jgi:hypothetical protein
MWRQQKQAQPNAAWTMQVRPAHLPNSKQAGLNMRQFSQQQHSLAGTKVLYHSIHAGPG